MRRPRLSPAIAALALTGALGATPAGAATAAATPAASAAKAPAAKHKKKKSTAARVTALSRSLNRAKAQQRAAQKQIDGLVRQQTAIGDTLSGALTALSPAGALASSGGLLAALQDPATGIPQYFKQVQDEAIGTFKALLASQEYAVIAVTIGDSGAYTSPTFLISPDIPDIGAPVTVSGTIPIAVPMGLDAERIDVRVGAVSLENEKGGVADPPFFADLNHFSVEPAGFTGDVGDVKLTGGMAGVNFGSSPSDPTESCTAASAGCGAPVWSGGNPDFAGLPYWPITEKLVSFDGTQFGVRFDVTRMTPLTGGGKMASLTSGSTGPIRISTAPLKTGLAIMKANVSVTLIDPSVNPLDPFA